MRWILVSVAPGRPTPIETGGIYAHTPLPDNPPPLSREKDIQGYTPYLGYWLPLAITKKTPLFLVFSVNLPETTAKKYPLSRENGNSHAAPYAFEWGPGVSL